MPELWFFVGLVMGILVTGFVAVGSFERGANSVRMAPWRVELAARLAHAAPSAPPQLQRMTHR